MPWQVPISLQHLHVVARPLLQALRLEQLAASSSSAALSSSSASILASAVSICSAGVT